MNYITNQNPQKLLCKLILQNPSQNIFIKHNAKFEICHKKIKINPFLVTIIDL